MAMDVFKNLAYGVVLLPPTPPNLGTALTLASGHGARFGAAPFNVSIWPFGVPADPTNTEIARCTAKSGDVLTLQRQQEGTQLRTILSGDQVAQAMTTKFLTDLINDMGTTMDQKIATAIAPYATRAYADSQDAAYWAAVGKPYVDQQDNVLFNTTHLPRTLVYTTIPGAAVMNVDAYDWLTITAQATPLVVNDPVGTPHEGQLLLYRLRDDGAAPRAITWSAIHLAGGSVPLPAATVQWKTMHVGFRYSGLYNRWMMIAFIQEA